jgi:simple sugar transport system ATP-binding protein
MAAPIVSLAHVSKSFGGVRALIDVDFEVREGEVHCLAGENGCGKSTLIKIVSGVHAPEPGAVLRFAGERVEGLTPVTARRLGIQVIWQDLALFPEMTVAENIAFEANLGGRPRLVRYGAMRAMAEAALARSASISLWAVPCASLASPSARSWRSRGPSSPMPGSSSWTSPRPP